MAGDAVVDLAEAFWSDAAISIGSTSE